MGVRKAGQERVRTITQNSTGTYAITMPISEIRDLGWRKGQKVTIKRQGQRLVIEDWKE